MSVNLAEAPHETEDSIEAVRKKLGPEMAEELGPVIELAVAAHESIDGLDKMPLVLHCADVTLSPDLTTLEEKQLGLLHDAATPGYSNFTQEEFIERARNIGVSERVIAAALCFARPKEGWLYDDWISYLMRDDLTRKVKIADSDAAIAHFPAQSDNQMASWRRTRQRLATKEPETFEVTTRIAASMAIHALPDLRAKDSLPQAA